MYGTGKLFPINVVNQSLEKEKFYLPDEYEFVGEPEYKIVEKDGKLYEVEVRTVRTSKENCQILESNGYTHKEKKDNENGGNENE